MCRFLVYVGVVVMVVRATTTPTTTTTTTATTQSWNLVYRQKQCKNDGSDQGAEGDDCFSALSTIKNFRDSSDACQFQFKMVYVGAPRGPLH